ncbi:hypothetical protein Sme01_55190 [Sphaerisporangium melleum]|uniref:Uncharacterized protein n=1 Tax=Sphaerisporangium melleum TaxID=321316 RepID=A0A917R717_9ACTN|nr:hypothetical protein GCM10007964_39050 [Sphaerisporangium melleum]GII73043.1 hypothetical protein Sme01_55190 [Sphaerisporangium melleum]
MEVVGPITGKGAGRPLPRRPPWGGRAREAGVQSDQGVKVLEVVVGVVVAVAETGVPVTLGKTRRMLTD